MSTCLFNNTSWERTHFYFPTHEGALIQTIKQGCIWWWYNVVPEDGGYKHTCQCFCYFSHSPSCTIHFVESKVETTELVLWCYCVRIKTPCHLNVGNTLEQWRYCLFTIVMYCVRHGSQYITNAFTQGTKNIMGRWSFSCVNWGMQICHAYYVYHWWLVVKDLATTSEFFFFKWLIQHQTPPHFRTTMSGQDCAQGYGVRLQIHKLWNIF